MSTKRAPAKRPTPEIKTKPGGLDIVVSMVDASEVPQLVRTSKYEGVIQQALRPEVQSGNKVVAVLIPGINRKTGTFSLRKVFNYKNIVAPAGHRYRFLQDRENHEKFYVSVVPISAAAAAKKAKK